MEKDSAGFDMVVWGKRYVAKEGLKFTNLGFSSRTACLSSLSVKSEFGL